MDKKAFYGVAAAVLASAVCFVAGWYGGGKLEAVRADREHNKRIELVRSELELERERNARNVAFIVETQGRLEQLAGSIREDRATLRDIIERLREVKEEVESLQDSYSEFISDNWAVSSSSSEEQ